jgi:SAM-dependent methyltransferase
MFAPERHRELARLLDLQSGSHVVDLGYGPGLTLIEIAARLGPEGALVGVDSRPRPAPDVLVSDSRLSLIDADLDTRLPFPDRGFDRAICHNVLECLANPDAFLTEVWRVLAPGGLFVLGHSDFDTIIVTSEDLELTRRLVHNYYDTTLSWMPQSDGTIGRKLAGIVARSPFETESVHAWVNVLTSLEPGSPGHQAAHAVADTGHRHPEIDDDAIDEWLTGLGRLANADAFLYSVNDYAVLARKN